VDLVSAVDFRVMVNDSFHLSIDVAQHIWDFIRNPGGPLNGASTFQTYRSLWRQFSASPVRNLFQAVNKQALLEDMIRDLRARNLSRLQESARRMAITLLVEGGAPQ
jgi:hypothetical protein